MMRIKIITAFLVGTCIHLSTGQVKSIDSTAVLLDSIRKEVFVEHDSVIVKVTAYEPVVIDSLWLEAMYSSSLFENL